MRQPEDRPAQVCHGCPRTLEECPGERDCGRPSEVAWLTWMLDTPVRFSMSPAEWRDALARVPPPKGVAVWLDGRTGEVVASRGFEVLQ